MTHFKANPLGFRKVFSPLLSAVCFLPLLGPAFSPAAPAAEPPRIVTLIPANGATDVSPGVSELRVTFSVVMGKGFSWCGGGPAFPEIPEGNRPYWTPDGRTCVLPVRLKPNWQYQLGINAPSFQNFRSASGIPVEPVSYSFSTGAAPGGSIQGSIQPPQPEIRKPAKALPAFQMDLWDTNGRRVKSLDYVGIPLFLEFGACW